MLQELEILISLLFQDGPIQTPNNLRWKYLHRWHWKNAIGSEIKLNIKISTPNSLLYFPLLCKKIIIEVTNTIAAASIIIFGKVDISFLWEPFILLTRSFSR